MDLEAKVKAYAEEARRILLQRHLDERKPHGGKAYWQGYADTGNAIVKQDGVFKLVKVIGNVAVPKDTPVYIDQQNTVTVGFKKTVPVVTGGKKATLKPTTANRLKKPLIELVEEDPVFGWIMIYHSENEVINALNSGVSIAFSEAPYYGPDSDSETTENFQPISFGTVWRAAICGVYAETTNIGPFNGNSTASATAGDLSVSVSVTATGGGDVSDYDYQYEVVETGANLELETETFISTDQFGRLLREASARAYVHYFTFPNAKIYIQSPNNEDGSANIATVDLNDHVPEQVYMFQLIKNFAKVDDDISWCYTTYIIESVDMEEMKPTYTSNGYEITEFGKIYRGTLHVKTNIATGESISNYTPDPDYTNHFYVGEFAFRPSDGHQLLHQQANNYITMSHYNPTAVWADAYPNDWISSFSGIQWTPEADQNVSTNELLDFYQVSWSGSVWQQGLHGDAPNNTTDMIYSYDPLDDADERFANGQPYDNDYNDILNLPSLIAGGTQSSIPGVDDFVSISYGSGSNTFSRYGPNYVTQITVNEPNPNDRLEYFRLSYLLEPEPGTSNEEGEGQYP